MKVIFDEYANISELPRFERIVKQSQKVETSHDGKRSKRKETIRERRLRKERERMFDREFDREEVL
jgi:hypothetical protein